MTLTYKIIKDEQDRDAVEIIDTIQNRRVIDKESIVNEIARLQGLLDKFP